VIHLTTHQLSTYLDRELPESSTELVRRHLEGCAECTLRFDAFREQEGILDRVLVHDPGEGFFSGFADRVLGPARRPAPVEPIETRPPEPKPVMVAPVPERRTVAPAASKVRSRKQPAIPWFAAAILCLIVGAIGYTIPRPSRIPNPVPAVQRPAPPAALTQRPSGPVPRAEPLAKPEIPAPSPESPPTFPETAASSSETAARAPDEPEHSTLETTTVTPEPSVAPVRRFRTTTSVAPPTAPAMPRDRQAAGTPNARYGALPAPVPAPDEFASAPPSAAPLLAMARRASQAAAADSSAANLDTAADAWDRAVPALSGTEQTIARRHLAESRYRAWQAAPDAYRAAAAIASLRMFLVLAPPSPERDLAKEQLRRLGGGG
jgi:hypothetical protein